ncbi:hypothetical protein ACSMXN_11435 [Jatrophihabitans sp. DSM 45814]
MEPRAVTDLSTASGWPLLKMTDVLPRTLLAVAAMLVLAGLDLVGAILARRWADSGSVAFLAAGLCCFAVLFWVYSSSLRYAELIPITFGWIAALQVGLIVIERVRSAAAVPAGHWVAAAAIVMLEGYLLFAAAA